MLPACTYTTPPRLARDMAWDDLARAAFWLRDQRESRLPPAVAAGHLTPAEADRALAAARALANQWRWVIDPAQPPLPEWQWPRGHFGLPCYEIAADLARAAKTAAARRAADRSSVTLRDQADALASLHWLQCSPFGLTGTARIIDHIAAQRTAMPLATPATTHNPERTAA